LPGLFGFIAKRPREWAEPQLLRMVKALAHRSIYTSGTWMDEAQGIYVGWVARKGSFADALPLQNERGDVVLLFAGEEFPEPGSVAQLKARGHDVKPDDASYLVHRYEEEPAFPADLNGRFHGLLIDRRRNTAKLFNDRFGMCRLYYHEADDAFYFGSEAKSILAVCPELRAVNPKSLGELISCGCVMEDRTLFPGIFALPGASMWTFSNGRLRQKTTYFHPREWEEQEPLAPEPYYECLREALSRNLPRYFKGPEKAGISLTGGLDTRIIMACGRCSRGSFPSYTFSGTYRDCQDALIARKVARISQQPHQVITVGQEFLSRFSYYAEHSVFLAEGGVDVYRSPDLYVSEKALAIAPAKVVGTYGSEIVRHAVMFKPNMPMPGLFRPELLAYVQKTAETYASVRKAHPVTFAAFRQSPWYHYGVLALEQSQLTVRSPYLDNDFVRAIFRAPGSVSQEDVRLRLIKDGNPLLGALRSDRGVGGNAGRFASALTRGILNFTFKADYAYDYGMPQWLAQADHLFAPLHFERLFLGRHKLFHFRVWYRDALAEYVRQMLLDPKTLSRPYLDRGGVERVVLGHLKGNRNYTTEIHKLLTVELIHRLFVDSR
jgi:asparagine synthase (glutamine-hydrolysing)